ncbi:MAG: right-handed parallel beta-helix repeat-containing protein, partial [Lentisphaerae bacterium]|nr:right-handed parallel beta-helix repeat-containing protein [Lentisphaerota bacterium]
KTPTVSATLPAVSNPGVGFRSHTVANLGATLTDDGGQLPDVAFHYWESGTTATNTVPAGMREEETFIWPVGGLASGLTYEYRVSAANGAGTAWSGVSSFSMLPVNATIYVSSSGDNTDASTWATAYSDPAVAFASAESGDTIRLAGETFAAAPGFALSYVYLVDAKSNLRVEGGYQAGGATPGSRDPAKWPTILMRSSGSASVLRIQNSPDIVVEGVTITGGSYIQGGGVYLSGATQSAWLENCIITNNLLPAAGNTTDGGAGVFLASGTAVVTNCLVLGNKIVSSGLDNYYGRGGGVRVSGGTMTIRSSTIANNVAQGKNKNTAAPYNRGADGGGIYSRETAAKTHLENCTVVSNDFNEATAIGVRYAAGTLSITNSIVWGHAAGDLSNLPVDGSGHLLNVGRSLFNDAAMDGVAGCISADPLFRNAAAMDFTLQDGRHGAAGVSPAIDSGLRLPWMKGAVDLAGGKRLQSGAVDMGAYEAAGPRATLLLIR